MTFTMFPFVFEKDSSIASASEPSSPRSKLFSSVSTCFERKNIREISLFTDMKRGTAIPEAVVKMKKRSENACRYTM